MTYNIKVLKAQFTKLLSLSQILLPVQCNAFGCWHKRKTKTLKSGINHTELTALNSVSEQKLPLDVLEKVLGCFTQFQISTEKYYRDRQTNQFLRIKVHKINQIQNIQIIYVCFISFHISYSSPEHKHSRFHDHASLHCPQAWFFHDASQAATPFRVQGSVGTIPPYGVAYFSREPCRVYFTLNSLP